MTRQTLFPRPDVLIDVLACLFTIGYFVLALFIVFVIKNQLHGSSQTHTFALYFALSWFLVMGFLYAALAWALQKSKNLSLKKILLWFGIFVFILLPFLPVTSGDLYHYVLQGKVLSHYGKNPFTFPAVTLKHDIFYNFISPSNISYPTVYGPVFVLLSSVITFFFGTFFIAAVYAFKATFILLHLVNALLVYTIVQKIQPQLAGMATTLYAWNPFIFFEIALNGHNDSVMIFFILLSVCLYARKKFIWVMPALLLAVMSKYIAFLLVPMFFVFLLRQRGRIKPAAHVQSAIVSCLLMVALYAPFWQGVKTFDGFLSITKISYSNTMVPAIVSFFTQWHPDMFRNYLMVAFFCVYVFLFVRLIQRPHILELMRFSLWVFFWFFAIASTWLMTWYFLWALPFAFLSGEKKYMWIGVIITLLGLLANILPFLLLFIIAFLFVVFYHAYASFHRASSIQ